MSLIKQYDNGLRLVVKKIDGLLSVSAGIFVFTGSANESEVNNGISHFIEHTVFKGTKNRTAFQISDDVDRIGAQINAYTSKETTCYYTKSTSDHLKDCLEVLSDLFFNAVFDKKELDKEKGVILEEINMCNDTPEDLCFDLLDKAYYGNQGFGRTILGPSKNIRHFNVLDISSYMDNYYTADNVIISICGNIDEKETVKLVDEFFAANFVRLKSKKQCKVSKCQYTNITKTKKIEQSHVGICFEGFKVTDRRLEMLSTANIILGGGMSSRLFQKIREEMGLCYTIYSSPTQYKDNGIIQIYAGIAKEMRDEAVKRILDEIESFRRFGITNSELLRGKEQIKSSIILGQESTSAQMILYAKYLYLFNKLFDFEDKIKAIESFSLEQINDTISNLFDRKKMATATLGPNKKPIVF